jgi:hypothetical protein
VMLLSRQSERGFKVSEKRSNWSRLDTHRHRWRFERPIRKRR